LKIKDLSRSWPGVKKMNTMKQNDILKIFCNSNPEIKKNIEIAQKLIKEQKLEKAAEKYRDVGRIMLTQNLITYAVQHYSYAADLFTNCQKHLKAINTETTIYYIHLLDNNILELANQHEKIASYYKHYIGDFLKAGQFYLSSAKHHEANQNYRSAFKKAQFAALCFEETNERSEKINAHNLAFRMALQSGYFEKAGEHILKLYGFIKKDYSPHHLSVCAKGYLTFQRAERLEESLMFLKELINAHYNKGITQEKIIKLLITAQKLNLKVNKTFEEDYNSKIIIALGEDKSKIINYSIELRKLADDLGLTDISDFFYLQLQDYKKDEFKSTNKIIKYTAYSVWKFSCLYGTSLYRWLAFSFSTIILFGLIFSNIPCPGFFPECIQDFLYYIHPEINIASVNNLFSPFYYSTVTFTTLGYGDITPLNLSSQIFSVLEVFIGYLMLGGLLTVFSKKIIR
jgi:hypothetical protein